VTGWEKRDILYIDYVDWAGKAGLRQLSRPKFYEKLRQLGDRGVS
jgi:hypothetical protein